MSGVPITKERVCQLAAAWRVRPASNYHASDHHTPWDDIVFALQTCYFVAPDKRPQHPGGYVAFGQASRTRKVRIDFNLASDEQGDLILVVTAFDYQPK